MARRNKPYVEPRSNPSRAEQPRHLTARQKKIYRAILIIGILLFVSPIIVIALLASDFIPVQYRYLVVISGFGFFISLFLIDIGISKGRDRRPPRGEICD